MSPFYPPGVPCWIETEQPDPERARHFYTKLLQWTTEPVAGHDDYLIAALDDLTAAGIASASQTPARWTTYIAVDDVDAAAARVTDHHGTVRVQPFDLGDRARVARCEDPAGAPFGLWQAGELAGAAVKRIPGSWEISDLHCDDEQAVQDFYGGVFGWTTGTVDVGAGQWATMLRVPGYGDDRAMPESEQLKEGDADQHTGDDDNRDAADAIGYLAPVEPSDDGPDWRVTFTVAARDEAARTAERLGAEIVSEIDSRWSRTALARDPHGALFSLSQALPGN